MMAQTIFFFFNKKGPFFTVLANDFFENFNVCKSTFKQLFSELLICTKYKYNNS